MTRFHPTQDGLTVNDQPVMAERVVVDAGPDLAMVTVYAPGQVGIEGDGVVQVVREPTTEEIDAAAVEAIGRIRVSELEARCARTLTHTGRRDVYQVVLDTIVEMARE